MLVVNETIKWHVQVYNNMDTAEYVAITLKIINSTQSKDGSEHIFIATQMVAHNVTWTLPLEWKLTSIENEGIYKKIKSVYINGEYVETDVRSINGEDFRAVIELWIYNTKNNKFEHAKYDKEVLNQIWFNIG